MKQGAALLLGLSITIATCHVHTLHSLVTVIGTWIIVKSSWRWELNIHAFTKLFSCMRHRSQYSNLATNINMCRLQSLKDSVLKLVVSSKCKADKAASITCKLTNILSLVYKARPCIKSQLDLSLPPLLPVGHLVRFATTDTFFQCYPATSHS